MSDSSPQSFKESYMTPIALIAGALIIAGAVYFRGPSEPVAQQPDAQAPQVAVDIKKVKTDGSPFIGNANAPVTMAVWFDYQCSYCKMFEVETIAKIHASHIESGKVKVVLKDFQFLGADSKSSALFSRAMWELYPNHFYTWFKAVAATQDESPANVKALAAAIDGVDADRVERLMNEKKDVYQKAIDADYAEAQSFGFSGTPSTIIGTTFVNGAQPVDAVLPLLEAELSK